MHKSAPLLLLLSACGGDSWQVADSLSVARYSTTVTALEGGDVVVIGGFGNQSESLPTTELWDGKLWQTMSNIPEARGGHTATRLLDDRVLVIGGFVGDAPLRSAYTYDASTDAWTSVTEMPFGRGGHTAVALPDGRVFVHGGNTDINSPGPMIFDPSNESWTDWDGIDKHQRASHGAALFDSSGKVMIAGGLHEIDDETRQLAAAGDAWRFNPDIEDWDSDSSMFDSRAWHAMVGRGDGVVMVAGGSNQPEPAIGDQLDSVEVFSGGSWSLLGSLSSARMRPAGLLTEAGAMVIIGGDHTLDHPVAIVDIADPIEREVIAGMEMPTKRTLHSATTLDDGRIMVVGGWDGLFATSAVEIYSVKGRYR